MFLGQVNMSIKLCRQEKYLCKLLLFTNEHFLGELSHLCFNIRSNIETQFSTLASCNYTISLS